VIRSQEKSWRAERDACGRSRMLRNLGGTEQADKATAAFFFPLKCRTVAPDRCKFRSCFGVTHRENQAITVAKYVPTSPLGANALTSFCEVHTTRESFSRWGRRKLLHAPFPKPSLAPGTLWLKVWPGHDLSSGPDDLRFVRDSRFTAKVRFLTWARRLGRRGRRRRQILCKWRLSSPFCHFRIPSGARISLGISTGRSSHCSYISLYEQASPGTSFFIRTLPVSCLSSRLNSHSSGPKSSCCKRASIGDGWLEPRDVSEVRSFD
jgi:hypothetical protein